MRCPDCRQKELVLTTRWERFRFWMFRTLFAEEYADLTQEKYTQGFGDGYKVGFQHCKERQNKRMSGSIASIQPMPIDTGDSNLNVYGGQAHWHTGDSTVPPCCCLIPTQ